jgi:heat shock protein HslJ
VDWPGIYRGVVPCGEANCEGIEIFVTLRSNLTYQQETRYWGQPGQVFNQAGTFRWNAAGSEITLKPNRGETSYLKVGENQLFLLDAPGKPKGDRWLLKKIAPLTATTPDASLTNTYWKLTELRGKPVVMDNTSTREVHLVLEAQGRKVRGFGGCNRFQGQYQMGGRPQGNATWARLSFSPLASTKMACPQMAVESELFQVLASVDHYSLKGNTLILGKGRQAPLAKFEAVYLR